MKEKIEHQREHFNKIACEYITSRSDKSHLLYKRLLWEFVFSKTPVILKTNLSVLEPMCGYAEGKKLIEQFYTSNIKYEGFDYSDELVKIVKHQNPELDICVADITTYRFEKKYDLIILLSGLHHVPEYTQQILLQVKRALNKGGIFINYEPTHNNIVYKEVRQLIYKRNHIFDAATERDFALQEINIYYKKAGFKILKQFYPGLLAYMLYGNPDAFPFLNRGGDKGVSLLMRLEKPLYTTCIARLFSFSAITILA